MAERPGTSIADLLHRLNRADAGAAWAEFIDHFSAVILKVMYQFEYSQDRDTECFLYVCEKLSERQFRRLQSFNVTGKAGFRNWLGTVVFNLCVDWHRAEFGRATLLPAIAALPVFDRLVYRNCYEQGMSREACFQAIKSDFPELTGDHVSSALARIHGLLTPRQRWQISVRNQRRANAGPRSAAEAADFIANPSVGPDVQADNQAQAVALQAALRQLSTDQRLLLHLRFQEGLSYQRIADIERLGNAHRARRHVQAALDRLFLILNREKPGQKRQF
jgi:RNA polymerase sigma factor (sigma-70 family)